MGKCYLITGTAGFIGFYLAKTLLENGEEVVGIDNFTPYYSIVLKQARQTILEQYTSFHGIQVDLTNLNDIHAVFEKHAPSIVCHLAAQPGVRYSLSNPHTYIQNNVVAFVNMLETIRYYKLPKFVYASSSSVYGNITDIPYSEEQCICTPISLYAATKCSDELLAYTYSHIFGVQTIGLRFFTVYGPWGRPDMAIWKFCDSIQLHKKIQLYNCGKNMRDFTYITDVVAGIIRALHFTPTNTYEIFNIGNNHPESTMTLVNILETYLHTQANMEFLPAQPGDMETTYANIDKAKKYLGYNPETSLSIGLAKFVEWWERHQNLVSSVRQHACLG